ncbi:MAG: hypothetical protein F6J95_012310 [Leptolyngbya sp. SIO1E4]|nr:hypothetical protein [Leptolyngbya sp. SIO1E4]
MTNHSATIPHADARAIVDTAVKAFRSESSQRPNGVEVTASLLALEKAAKRNRRVISPDSLLGTWRLCFSAGKKAHYQSGQPMGNGFYIPKLAIAQITFTPDKTTPNSLTIANELRVGPLGIRFTGPARYPGPKNLLAFALPHLEVRCFGLLLYRGAVGADKRADKPFEETAIAQLPFFALFAVTEDYIAARGRGGGLAVWSRSPVPD